MWIIFFVLILLAAAFFLRKTIIEMDRGDISLKFVSWIFVGLAAILVAWNSFVIIPTGSVGVISTFGVKNLERYIPEGSFGLKWFWQDVEEENIRVTSLDFSGDRRITGASSNAVQVSIEVSVPIRLEASAAPLVRARINGEWENYIYPFVRSALRDALARTTWQDARNGNREALAANVRSAVEAKIRQNLLANGFPEAVANRAFVISEPLIRQVNVPSRISNALNEQSAVEIDRATSITRAEVAQNEIRVREAEGQGYSSLLTGLPAGVSPAAAADMMRAQARLKEVEAIQAGIEEGTIDSVTIVTGGADVAVRGQ